MSEQQSIGYAEFVRLVVEALEAADVEYLIGGALALWAWGEPRSTLDLDLVVDIPVESIGALSKELEFRDMLVPPEIILNSLIEEQADIPINAIHMHSAYKADLYPLRPKDELRQSALKRKKKVDFGPPIGIVYVHSPEDLILYKVWYYSISKQTKHVRDVNAILQLLMGEIDFEYVESWAERRGLSSVWQRLYGQFNSQP